MHQTPWKNEKCYYRVHHGNVGILDWLNGYQNASPILLEGGFEIPTLDVFKDYNEFLWNGSCAPFIRPDVSRPQFILFFAFFVIF